MPNLKSAAKRMRIEQKRRARNRAVKSTVKTFINKAQRGIVTEPGADATTEALRQAISQLDRAATKGVLHKNNVARRKSRLMKRLNKALTPQS
jgi:small subunit ribosomal protein S20